MPAIRDVNIKCGHCGSVFRSEIQFGSTESLHSAITEGNTQYCPSCGQIVHCNKDNMSYRFADGSGGGVGDNYADNIAGGHAQAAVDVFAEARQKLADWSKKNGKG